MPVVMKPPDNYAVLFDELTLLLPDLIALFDSLRRV